MITRNNWLNAIITLAWIINILFINLFIINLTSANNPEVFIKFDSGTYKIGLIICSVIIVVLHGIKLYLFLSNKEEK